MKFKPSNNSCGTYLQGYINKAYADIVKILGEPHTNDGYKVDAEWCVKFENGTIATLYNYKDGKNYLGDEGLAADAITDWHVGGNSQDALIRMKELLTSN